MAKTQLVANVPLLCKSRPLLHNSPRRENEQARLYDRSIVVVGGLSFSFKDCLHPNRLNPEGPYVAQGFVGTGVCLGVVLSSCLLLIVFSTNLVRFNGIMSLFRSRIQGRTRALRFVLP